jgi:hypothetical protein
MPIPDDVPDALAPGGVIRLDMVTRPNRALRIMGRALLPVLLDGRRVELDVIVAAGPNGRCLISDDPALGAWLAAAG